MRLQYDEALRDNRRSQSLAVTTTRLRNRTQHAERRLWAAEGYADGKGVAMQIAGSGVPTRSVLAPWVALF
jgi:hypothetical protein